MPALANLSFQDWLEHAFSHEVRPHGNAWYFDDGAPWWNPEPHVAVRYLTDLFAEPEKALEWFSDAQIAQGLTYLVNTTASGDSGWLYCRSVPTEVRRRCVKATLNLFTTIFAPRCAPVLGHIDEPGGKALNTVCYMWWDVFPCVALADDPDREGLNLASLDVMEQMLQLDSLVCQESALHGLGHSQRTYPAAATAIIDRFLADGRPKRSELVVYANSARCGCVL
jgi:hypothetical protein